jgi:hypothetical protein
LFAASLLAKLSRSVVDAVRCCFHKIGSNVARRICSLRQAIIRESIEFAWLFEADKKQFSAFDNSSLLLFIDKQHGDQETLYAAS